MATDPASMPTLWERIEATLQAIRSIPNPEPAKVFMTVAALEILRRERGAMPTDICGLPFRAYPRIKQGDVAIITEDGKVLATVSTIDLTS